MSTEQTSVNIPVINQQGLNYNTLLKTPDTVNPFLTTNFKFTLNRLPNVTFWCTSVNIPSVSIGEVTVHTQMMPIHVPGSSVSLDQLRVTFMVDENFTNWRELYYWMRGIMPFEDFTDVITNESNYYSDGIVHCLNSAKNANVRWTFKKMFPVSISGFDLNVAMNDVDPATINATFVFDSFDIETVT